MLRELSQTLLDMHAGLQRLASDESKGAASVRITGMELTLPVDVRMIFADGECRLLADVPRARLQGSLAAPASRLSVVLERRPTRTSQGEGA